MIRMLLFVIVFACSTVWADGQSDDQGVDLQEIENQLKGDGLGGWIHGAVNDSHMFVFTWRHPDNFFVNVQFPMVPKDKTVAEKISGLRRHDFVTLKGSFVKNDAPLKHILITEVAGVQKWTGPGSDLDYDYKGLPEDVYQNASNTFKVHAVANGGAVIVVEYKDRVFPVLNTRPETAANLYRNDKVFLKYVVRGDPLNPTHLEIDYKRNDPFLILDRIVVGHGTEIQLTGPLVMFPKSPQIIFNVYALRQEDDLGLRRNFTLVNFEDMDLFTAIREKLEEAWAAHESKAAFDRNKFINRKILVTAKGTKNVVDPNQANPQILINNIDDLKLHIIDAE